MAKPATRETLKQYALRALGKPVIDINVDDDQLEDRLDEAYQYYAQYHYDGIRRTYLKYQYTQDDYNRMTVDGSVESQSKNSVTTNWKEGQGFLVVPESVISVINVLPFSSKGNLNLFDVISADKFIMSKISTKKLKSIFSYSKHFKNVNLIFRRVFK